MGYIDLLWRVASGGIEPGTLWSCCINLYAHTTLLSVQVAASTPAAPTPSPPRGRRRRRFGRRLAPPGPLAVACRLGSSCLRADQVTRQRRSDVASCRLWLVLQRASQVTARARSPLGPGHGAGQVTDRFLLTLAWKRSAERGRGGRGGAQSARAGVGLAWRPGSRACPAHAGGGGFLAVQLILLLLLVCRVPPSCHLALIATLLTSREFL